METMTNIEEFCTRGKAAFILGGQFGSEGKGAAAAWLAHNVPRFDIVTTNAAAQAGHTSIHNGQTRVVFHLPTAPLIKSGSVVFLNNGCIIDPDVLKKELDEHDYLYRTEEFYIGGRAAIITQACKDAEGADDSHNTKIASTRKGVGEALAAKVRRSGVVAQNHPDLVRFCKPMNLTQRLVQFHKSVLVEVPQGYDLSLNGPFYPHTTSRNCTLGQAISDADIHPHLVGHTMLVLRTYPIRVGNITDDAGRELGNSGGVWPDQVELSWESLGRKPEITTVTKRVRRVFSWSSLQIQNSIMGTRPAAIFLTHCDYLPSERELNTRLDDIRRACHRAGIRPCVYLAFGPSTLDVKGPIS